MKKRFDVTIAGEINLDLILGGLPETLPVERQLLASSCSITLGSPAAILAHNCAALGMSVGFASLAAKDMFGVKALNYLTEQGVDLSELQTSEGDASSGITVVLNHSSARHILCYQGPAAELARHHLDLEYLCSGRHFHLSSLFRMKALQPDLPEMFKAMKARDLTISLDTGDDPDDHWDGSLEAILPLVDVLLADERQLLQIAKRDSFDEALAALSGKVKLIVIKRGASGVIVQQGLHRHEIPAIAVTPVDTVGASDSFNAGFLNGYVRGLSPQDCAEMGNITAAVSTLKAGSIEAFTDQAFLHAALAKLAPAARKVS